MVTYYMSSELLMNTGKNMFFTSLTWLNILCITSENQLSQEATHIHTQTTWYRLTVWSSNVFFSVSYFIGRLNSEVTMKGPIQ